MMKFKKFLSMLLMASLVLSLHTPVAAQQAPTEGEIAPQYTNMTNITSELRIINGTAYCDGSCKLTSNKTAELEMTLLRSNGSTAYTSYATWSKTISGIGTHTLSKEKSVTKGYKYRLKVVVKVYSGSTLVESGASYSAIISY